MLTATYALVAISAEQQNTRRILSRMENSVDDNFLDRSVIEPVELKTALGKLTMVDQYFHARVVERSVIPIIRNATAAKEDLLGELEAWSRHAQSILQHLRGYLEAHGKSRIEQRAEELHASMEQFCHALMKRLDQEEAELFPLAQQVLTSDEWFEVATHCLADKESQARKPLQQLSEADLFKQPAPTRNGIERRMKQRYAQALDMGESQTMWP